MYQVPLRPVTDLARVIALIGMFNILDLQIVSHKGYPWIHCYLLLTGTQ